MLRVYLLIIEIVRKINGYFLPLPPYRQTSNISPAHFHAAWLRRQLRPPMQ